MSELRRKQGPLTNAEMNELASLSPPGAFWSLGNLQTIGVVNIQRAFQNLTEGAERTKHALKNKCYLEVISLRLQLADFWLRMYWAAKSPKGKIFSPDDKRTFGMLIKDCACLGFSPDLVCRLKEFNRHRIDAIHKYLLGATSYDDLEKVCEDSLGLNADVFQYVLRETRRAVTGLSA